MREYVLDTSVAVAWYLPEVFSQSARKWQHALLDETITCFVPSLHYWEFANVLRTYVRRREIQASLAQEIFTLHLDAPLAEAEPRRMSILSTAIEYGTTVYDAVFISLSLEQDIPLLTAEKSTTPWVVKLSQRVEIVR